MGYEVRDASLKVTKALPNGAATINSDGIDLGHNTTGQFLTDCEFLLTCPALTTGELADNATMKYSVQHDTDSAFGTVATLLPAVVTQTGAGGAGAGATTYRFRLPSTVKRYVRISAVNSASGNASAKSLTFEVLV